MSDQPSVTPSELRRKRTLLRLASSINVMVIGFLSVQMWREPKLLTMLVILVAIVAVYRLDRAADNINPIQ
jgi:hypothetical protein